MRAGRAGMGGPPVRMRKIVFWDASTAPPDLTGAAKTVASPLPCRFAVTGRQGLAGSATPASLRGPSRPQHRGHRGCSQKGRPWLKYRLGATRAPPASVGTPHTGISHMDTEELNGGRPRGFASFLPLRRGTSQTVGQGFIFRCQFQQRLGDGLVAHQRRHALVVRGFAAQPLTSSPKPLPGRPGP